MGYRSEVVLAVGKAAMAQFLTTLAKSPPARQLCFEFSDEVVKDYEDEEGALLFKWTQIKWYEGYESIDALTDFMDWCDAEEDEDMSEGYKFVRVGEDSEDIESRGFGFMYLYPVTSIHSANG